VQDEALKVPPFPPSLHETDPVGDVEDPKLVSVTVAVTVTALLSKTKTDGLRAIVTEVERNFMVSGEFPVLDV
jgi:hypothetical protein